MGRLRLEDEEDPASWRAGGRTALLHFDNAATAAGESKSNYSGCGWGYSQIANQREDSDTGSFRQATEIEFTLEEDALAPAVAAAVAAAGVLRCGCAMTRTPGATSSGRSTNGPPGRSAAAAGPPRRRRFPPAAPRILPSTPRSSTRRTTGRPARRALGDRAGRVGLWTTRILHRPRRRLGACPRRAARKYHNDDRADER